ncbi:MAG: type II toxin-antitoxin system MqsA family antitoxin [Dehalococcoidia bacterium]
MDPRMVTRCFLCGGETARQFITAENWWSEAVLLAEGVPADVCQQCGEAYFDTEICRALDQIRRTLPAVARTVEVPVYAYAGAA